MFTPRQYTNRGRHGQIFNVDGTEFCSWMMNSKNEVMVFNDPITQVVFLTQEDLYLAMVWVIDHLISGKKALSGIT